MCVEAQQGLGGEFGCVDARVEVCVHAGFSQVEMETGLGGSIWILFAEGDWAGCWYSRCQGAVGVQVDAGGLRLSAMESDEGGEAMRTVCSWY